ncbi:ATP-binding protein [Streptomyces leeuwenhoekii]|uniref:ATP-binding protein n=1 Tax=Streptomyces leeuwenhoekii TaxID=1437453 RepID=UPI00099747D2|nr:ATP-binding protein [Streptomyces leeuwenhoekii]
MNGPADRSRTGRPVQASVTLERGSVRIAEARRWTVGRLAEARDDRGRPLPDQVVEAAQLVVSELVTNAVKYGSDPVELTLAFAGDCLSITVRDGDPTLPAPRRADPVRVGQHGLEIVAALSRDVDVRREPSGKRITARIPLASSRGDRPGATGPVSGAPPQERATWTRTVVDSSSVCTSSRSQS